MVPKWLVGYPCDYGFGHHMGSTGPRGHIAILAHRVWDCGITCGWYLGRHRSVAGQSLGPAIMVGMVWIINNNNYCCIIDGSDFIVLRLFFR